MKFPTRFTEEPIIKAGEKLMKFKDVYQIVGNLPCTEENQCRTLYDWVVESRPGACLELGFLHGKSSCVIGAALAEIGSGHLTSIDLEWARTCGGSVNLVDNLEKTGLAQWVTPVFSPVSYTWELKKIIEQQTSTDGRCAPCFDFVFLDGAHTWETDVCAFFLAMKLLRPGGWFLFDDYMWSISGSTWASGLPQNQALPKEYLTEKHVERLVTLVVQQHPDVESVVIRDNWAWARKKSGGQNVPGPSVQHLNKTLIKRWLSDKLFGR